MRLGLLRRLLARGGDVTDDDDEDAEPDDDELEADDDAESA